MELQGSRTAADCRFAIVVSRFNPEITDAFINNSIFSPREQTLLVHGESVGENALVRRALVERFAHQQRAVEPAAMLVRAFEVHLDRRLQFELAAIRQRHDQGVSVQEQTFAAQIADLVMTTLFEDVR